MVHCINFHLDKCPLANTNRRLWINFMIRQMVFNSNSVYEIVWNVRVHNCEKKTTSCKLIVGVLKQNVCNFFMVLNNTLQLFFLLFWTHKNSICAIHIQQHGKLYIKTMCFLLRWCFFLTAAAFEIEIAETVYARVRVRVCVCFKYNFSHRFTSGSTFKTKPECCDVTVVLLYIMTHSDDCQTRITLTFDVFGSTWTFASIAVRDSLLFYARMDMCWPCCWTTACDFISL